MEKISSPANIVLGIACLIGWIAGVIAWVRRGFGTPRSVHVTAISALIAFMTGIRSTGFTVFALLGFPAWAYAGWFFMGCPDGTGRANPNRYDISGVLKDKRKK